MKMVWLVGLLCLVVAPGEQGVPADCPSGSGTQEACSDEGRLASDMLLQKRSEHSVAQEDLHEEGELEIAIDSLKSPLADGTGETRQLEFTIDSAADVQNIGLKILEAMLQANLTMSEWVPVGQGSQNITDDDTFPETYKVTLERSDLWALDLEGFETLGEHVAYEEVLEDMHQQAQEAEEHDPAANESEPASLVALSAEEARAHLARLHAERFGALSPEEQLAARTGEVQVGINSDELSDEAVVVALQRAKKKKNSKQLKWASRAVEKLEAEVCTRTIKSKPAATVRDSRALSCSASWSGLRCTCHGWENIAGICYRPCASDEVGHWFGCHKTCNGWEDTGSTCNEKCNIESLTHIGTTCGLAYCSRNSGACAEKIAKLAVAFLEALSNFVPGGAAMAGLRTAAKAGTKAALKIAIKKAVKDVAKRLRKDAKKKLRKYMKQKGKELREDLLDAVMEGGVETAAETVVAKTETGSLKAAAEELVMAVDPTGVSSIVSEFQADSCSSKKIEDMPTDGFIETICPTSVTLSGVEYAQSTRMGTFDYTGEDNDERPIYQNDHNQFLYYLNGEWRVGSDTTSNSCGVRASSTSYCPPSSGWLHSHGGWKSSPQVTVSWAVACAPLEAGSNGKWWTADGDAAGGFLGSGKSAQECEALCATKGGGVCAYKSYWRECYFTSGGTITDYRQRYGWSDTNHLASVCVHE